MSVDVSLNPALETSDVINSFSKHFKNQAAFSSSGKNIAPNCILFIVKFLKITILDRFLFVDFEIVSDPYPCMILHNVIANSEALPGIEKALRRCRFLSKNNDLYSFKQTADFCKSSKPLLTNLR